MEGLDHRIVRFGTFEADFTAGELRKAGRRVHLQEQPFRLLRALLEHPGEVVTRSELHTKIWGDTQVDFEEGLNTAVRKLRDALGDSAVNPRFVETLPRRGYRFIAPSETMRATPATVPVPQRRRLGHRWMLAISGIAVAVVAAGIVVRSISRDEPLSLAASPPVQLTRDSGLTTEPMISRDGKLVVYSSDRGGSGNLDIWIQHTAGGDPVRLTDDPADDREPDISPDGRTVIFRSERDPAGIYSVPALGGASHPILKGGSVPRFSPDGTRIAYATGHSGAGGFSGKLHIYTRASGRTQDLVPNLLAAGPVTWSPDGSGIAFAGADNALLRPLHLWFCSTNGGEAVRMTERAILDDTATFGQLGIVSLAWFDPRIILSLRERDSSNLWAGLIDAHTRRLTGDLKRLTLGAGTETLPSISDAGQLAFATHSHSSAIWEATEGEDLTSPGTRRLTHDRAMNYRPSLSADGSKLAYISDRTGHPDVWLRDLNTGKETALTRGEKAPVFVSISRDASQVAFWDGGAIYLVASSGGSPRLLCERCGRPDDWSVDGKIITAPFFDLDAIGVRDPKTGSFTRIASHSSRHTTAPDFSSDGKWLTFHIAENPSDPERRLRSKRQIFVAPYRGDWIPESDWTAVTDGEALDREPKWSTSGDRIYFVSDRDGFRCIWARKLNSQTKQPLGEIYPVAHLHDSRFSFLHIPNTGNISLQSLGDKLIFAVGELTGNLWMTDLRPR